jgi:hypothetical protein
VLGHYSVYENGVASGAWESVEFITPQSFEVGWQGGVEIPRAKFEVHEDNIFHWRTSPLTKGGKCANY